MTAPRPLCPRQRRFVEEYAVDHNGAQAAIRAGYAPESARVTASKLLTKPNVASAVAALDAEVTQNCGLSVQWVLEALKANHARAVEAGDLHAANRAIELIGKHFAAFTDRVKLEDLTDLSDAELAAIAAGRAPK